MFVKNLPDQVQALIEHYCDGSLLAFSKKIDVPQSTLQRYMATRDEKNILKILPKILHHCPEVREGWLYTGEGEMLGRSRPNGVRSALNSKGRLVGDLLGMALGLTRFGGSDVAKVAKVDKAELQAVLESSEYPSFLLLQKFYDKFGLNAEFLFNETSELPLLPLSELQVVEFFVGRKSDYPPHADDLQKWFGCRKDEALEYLDQYKVWFTNVYKYGLGHQKTESSGPPCLKTEWIEYFCDHAALEWLPGMHPQDGGFINMLSYSIKEKINIERELVAAQAEIIKLQKDVINRQNEIIELKDRLTTLQNSENFWESRQQDSPADLPESAPGGQRKI